MLSRVTARAHRGCPSQPQQDGDGATPAKTACAGFACRMATVVVQGVGPRWRPSQQVSCRRWWSSLGRRPHRRARTRTLGTAASRGRAVTAEQERQRKDQERIEVERLAELNRRVERERVEAETMELERHKVLERHEAAMARGQEAEHERQEEPCGNSERKRRSKRQEMKLCGSKQRAIAREIATTSSRKSVHYFSLSTRISRWFSIVIRAI